MCSLSCATEDFLIPSDRNIYNIEFTRFILRNIENNQTLIDVGQPSNVQIAEQDCEAARFVKV